MDFWFVEWFQCSMCLSVHIQTLALANKADDWTSRFHVENVRGNMATLRYWGAKEPVMMYFPTKWETKEPQNLQNHRVEVVMSNISSFSPYLNSLRMKAEKSWLPFLEHLMLLVFSRFYLPPKKRGLCLRKHLVCTSPSTKSPSLETEQMLGATLQAVKQVGDFFVPTFGWFV